MAAVLPIVFAIAGGLCLLLVLLAAWQSVRALLGGVQDGAADSAASSEPARRELVREKDTLLAAIRELRFERDLGKVSEADHAQLEGRYRGRAREVLRLLDEEIEPHREAARALIEATRAGSATASGSASGKAAGPAAAELTPQCAACGTRNDVDASFCKKCGGKLTGKPEAESRS